MVIVSCPHCFKATYVVLNGVKTRGKQIVTCTNCKGEMVIEVIPRRGKRVDVVCSKPEQSDGDDVS